MLYPVAIDKVIGGNVHQLMWERHVRHQELYAAMGLSRSSLTKKMRGEVAWSASDIAKAAEVLDVDPGRLFVAGAGFEPATSGLRTGACRWCQAHHCDAGCWCDCHRPTAARADDLALAA